MKKIAITFITALFFVLPGSFKVFSQDIEINNSQHSGTKEIRNTDTITAGSEQTTSLIHGLPEGLSISGYADAYISYDNDKSGTLRRFSSIAPFRDEFKLNLASIAIRYAGEKVRGNITAQYGDIPQINWPSDNRLIQEANIGVQAFKDLWVDAGYFLTHIGGEGIVPKNNYFTSLSLCTYAEPFFQSGVRVSYSSSEKFSGQIHLLNGYNVLTDNNYNKSIGLTLDYKPHKEIEFIYNNIIGNEIPAGNTGKTRIYNNLVVKYNSLNKLETILCADYCVQEKSKLNDTSASGNMFSMFAALRYRIIKTFAISLRAEYFQDKDGFMLGTFNNPVNGETLGLTASGGSIAFEYNPVDFSYFRIESRFLKSSEKVFVNNDGTSNTRIEVILSSGIQF